MNIFNNVCLRHRPCLTLINIKKQWSGRRMLKRAQTLWKRSRASTESRWRVSMQGAAYTHACILYTTPQRGVEAESSQPAGRDALTSDFSILFWASTCVMISFMLVSRTIPPITISARIWWTWSRRDPEHLQYFNSKTNCLTLSNFVCFLTINTGH